MKVVDIRLKDFIILSDESGSINLTLKLIYEAIVKRGGTADGRLTNLVSLNKLCVYVTARASVLIITKLKEIQSQTVTETHTHTYTQLSS